MTWLEEHKKVLEEKLEFLDEEMKEAEKEWEEDGEAESMMKIFLIGVKEADTERKLKELEELFA